MGLLIFLGVSGIIMKLINCPVCGTRVSADIESCPECGFEIKEYLGDNGPSEKGADFRRRRLPSLIAAPAVAASVVMLLFFFFLPFKAPTMDHRADAADEGGEGNETDGSEDSGAGNGDDGDDGSVLGNGADGDADSVSVNGPDRGDDVRKDNDGDKNEASPVGVYNGNDNGMLVLHANGYAYYYCSQPEFTELECPWTYSDETVSIEFSKMHCTVTARKIDKDFSELIFKADSLNWNTEVFTRMNLDPDEYINRYIAAYDPAVTILRDGSMRFELNGIYFTIPKMYQDREDEFDEREDALLFLDTNSDFDYVSALLFYRRKNYNEINGRKIYEEINQDLAVNFIGSFLNNPAAVSAGECSVAGYPGQSFDISGNFNNGFRATYGAPCSGKLYIIPNGDANLFVFMIQSDGRGLDASGIYEEIIAGAE